MKLNKIFLVTLIVVCLYHYFIQNSLEKMFINAYIHSDTIKRPLSSCNNKINNTLSCIGMPSGHAEIITIISIILYCYKYINLPICIMLIVVVSLQRVLTDMHTFLQITVGIIIGILYSLIYIYFKLSYKSFLIIISIGVILNYLILNKYDKQVYGPIPDWVDPEMLTSISKKQNVPYYIKFFSITLSLFIQGYTYISWTDLEKYLDILIDRIKHTNIKFDSVVGIKTGGAIISNYIAKKLNIKNYKIKLMDKKYKCNKNISQSINNTYNKYITKYTDNYEVCTGIEDNLEGKNIILIDEALASGITFKNAINYLKYNKKVNVLYPMCIAFYNINNRKDLQIEYVFNTNTLIWPWGYDN